MANYGCPKCGEQLEYWEEFIFQKVRTVKKKTGELNMTTKRIKPVSSDIRGLRCVNKKCGFEYNFWDKKGNSNLDSILENINYTL